MYKFKFADIGEGLHEGVVAEIYKNKGDEVKEGDSLFLVETDKVTSDIPSPVTGKVVEVLAKAGDTIHVGDVIYHISEDGKDESSISKPQIEEAKEEKQPKNEDAASVVGDIKVSNDLFSFDMFKKPSSIKEVSKPENVTTTFSDNSKSKGSLIERNIQPIGDGKQVDVVVIGGGPGGYKAGEFLAREGHKVVVIEKEWAGGVCLNVGCIPTKALLKSAKIVDQINHASKYGINLKVKNIEEIINWTSMQKRKDEITQMLSNGVKMLLKSVKVEYIEGEAKVIDRYNIEVNKKHFTTKIIIIATGATPIMLPLPGFDEAIKKNILIDSTKILALKKIPKSLVIVGGGVIGVEFAALFNTLGTKVTIIEGANSILPILDKDVKDFASNMLKEKNIEIIVNAKVSSFKNGKIIYEHDGKKYSKIGEKVLLSIGRKPNNINIDKSAGVIVGKRGEIIVDDSMQTNINNIFAIGDVTAQSMFAHTAYKHAHVVVNNLKGESCTWNINEVPASIYTFPEISMIGKTEQQLLDEKVGFIKAIWQNKNVGKVLADGDKDGFTKLLIAKETGEILGAHIINANSSDMITEIAVVMKLEGTVYELADTIHPHPSICEGIYEAAMHAKIELDELNK